MEQKHVVILVITRNIYLCVPGKLVSALHALFHLTFTMTLRGGDIINIILQMRKPRFTKVQVIELARTVT